MGPISVLFGRFRLPNARRLNTAGVFAAAIVVTVGVSLIAQHLHKLSVERQRLAERLIQDGLVSQLARDLSADLENTSVELQALADWISVEPEVSSETFDAYSARVLERHVALRSMTLLPGDVIRFAFPPNPALIGLDVGKHPEQSEAVRSARQSRSVVLTGPVRLKQGGDGLILRAPVFQNTTGGEHYWGHVSAVLGLERIVLRLAAVEREHGLSVRLVDANGTGLTAGFHIGETHSSDTTDGAVVSHPVSVGRETWTLSLSQSDDVHRSSGLGLALLIFGHGLAAALGLATVVLGLGVLHLRQRNELLVVNEAKALRATNAKSDFLATMSHELRTPLNGVIATAELLGQTEQTSEQVELTETIASSGKVLLAVVNDILDFSKLETGRMTVEEVPVVLRELCNEVQEIGTALARGKDLTFEVEVSDAAPNACITDPARLRQVLINLISNAVKATESGWVTLLVTTENAIDGRRLCFTVTDTGVGIADVNLLFREFHGETSSPAPTKSGLGLAISNRIAALLGGSIKVTSRVGEGSTFSFSIPLVIAQTSTIAGLASAPPTSGTGKCLVVDDNAVNRLVAQKILLKLGWNVELASGGQEAIALGSSGNYDLILMDVQMPGVDGLQATKELRKLSTVRQTPIVAMTAGASFEDRERCLASGMDDHLPKPINLESVRRILRQWGSSAKSARALATKAQPNQAPANE